MRRIAALGAAFAAAFAVAGCGGESDRSSAIASETGASSCTATDYQIINRLDNTKARIYDCFINGAEKCVTEENGIANDETATAKILFASSLSGGKPDCAK